MVKYLSIDKKIFHSFQNKAVAYFVNELLTFVKCKPLKFRNYCLFCNKGYCN